MPDVTDRTLAARWLSSARRATIAAQLVLMVLAEAGTELHLHGPGLLALLTAWAAADAWGTWRRRHGADPGAGLGTWAALDLAALTGILIGSGAQHSPLLFAYLAYLALLAMVLPPRHAWLACAAAIGLQGYVVLHTDGPGPVDPVAETRSHRLGHVITFDLSAVGITWVVTRLAAELRERAARERAVERERETTHRLAALGTLAAGVAHELGTPLGAIQLLAEQVARDPSRQVESLALLREQVARCRDILERLRGRDTPEASTSALDVARWVAEWERSAPEVRVTVTQVAPSPWVRGSAESWRAALWVALDNARRAGARTVGVTVDATGEPLEVRVEDDGHGLDPEAAGRVGEPFWTGWGGTGLGLFVSRSFAQSVGGDVIVEPTPPRGARTRLLLPRAPA